MGVAAAGHVVVPAVCRLAQSPPAGGLSIKRTSVYMANSLLRGSRRTEDYFHFRLVRYGIPLFVYDGEVSRKNGIQ